jgi:hypothetical protein
MVGKEESRNHHQPLALKVGEKTLGPGDPAKGEYSFPAKAFRGNLLPSPERPEAAAGDGIAEHFSLREAQDFIGRTLLPLGVLEKEDIRPAQGRERLALHGLFGRGIENDIKAAVEPQVLKPVVKNGYIKPCFRRLKAGGQTVPPDKDSRLGEIPGDKIWLISPVFPGPENAPPVRENAARFFPASPITASDKGGTAASVKKKPKEFHGEGGLFGAAEGNVADADDSEGRLPGAKNADAVEPGFDSRNGPGKE